MATQSVLKEVELAQIRENPVALRSVDRESEVFIGLRDSIRAAGFFNPISVRERVEDVEGVKVTFFEIIDGLQRYTCATELSLKKIPVIVKDLDECSVLEGQLMANIHRIETKPVEYTKQLQRIFASNPAMTVSDMAAKLAKSPAWVSQRLGLLKLDESVQKLVNDGKIKVSNAYALSKLPREEQVNFVDQAMTAGADEFVPTISARAKEIKDANREGRKAKDISFVATPKLQKISYLVEVMNTGDVATQLCKSQKAKTPVDGFKLGVAHALNLDPVTVEGRKAAAEAKKRGVEDAKKRRIAERAKKKAAEAAEAAVTAAEAIKK